MHKLHYSRCAREGLPTPTLHRAQKERALATRSPAVRFTGG